MASMVSDPIHRSKGDPVAREQRLRGRLFLLTLLTGLGAIVELWCAEHTGSWIQYLPFAIAGMLALAAAIARWRPSRRAAVFGRCVAVVAILGSMFGVWEHLEHNYGFERDIRPNATSASLLVPTLHGASPPLAPGLLALGAVLLTLGWHQHPVLASPRKSDVETTDR